MRILLDTSILIDYLRRKDKENALFSILAPSHQLYSSILTHTETFSGKSVWEDAEVYNIVELIYSQIHLVSLDREISKRAGNLRANSAMKLPDAIIAATALLHDLPLATLNIKDFEKVKDLHLYKPSS